MNLVASAEIATMDRGDGYVDFRQQVQQTIAALIGPLFTTTTTGLWEAFLTCIPPAARQHYTCHACRRFIERYGGLVTLDTQGNMQSAVWPEQVPAFFQPAVDAMLSRILHSKVTGVFVSSQAVWGEPETGPWTHLSGATIPAALVYPQHRAQTAAQVAAEKTADFGMLCRALEEFPPAAITQALRVLRSDALYRGEKVLGVAEWLEQLHRDLEGLRGKARSHVLWRAVATAPAGFCHVRSTMIGTLLEDIGAGLPFEDIRRRFADKMHPLQYRRPTAPPSADNIAQAEKLVEQLGIAKALERRFARLGDVQALWLPVAPQQENRAAGQGVFAHLRPKETRASVPVVEVPARVMTWEKWRTDVLPQAQTLELWVPSHHLPYTALVTAAHADAPNLLQWDNPVSWYVYHHGSRPEDWNLTPQSWATVTALVLHPALWGTPIRERHDAKTVTVLLQGAKDMRYVKGGQTGGGFFPETLKADYHAIRSTLEAYAKQAVIQGAAEAEACGLALRKSGTWDALLRVNGTDTYRLNRWE